MCGIVGIHSRTPQDPASFTDIGRAMVATLRHRGPDGEEVWVDPAGRTLLGFARLAIIDLSPRAMQPMHLGPVSMTMNGEFFHFQDERRRLEQEGAVFRSAGDAEVALQLYVCHGLDALLERLTGFYAMAIVDRGRDEVILIRDRLGQKPLYYAETPAGLVWASEIKALRRHPAVGSDVDPDAIPLYLMLEHIPAPATIFRSIRKLPPGHVLVHREGRSVVRRYWELDYREKSGESDADFLGRYRSLLADAVRRRLIADVPLGLFLSGGLDSTLVAQEAFAQQPGLQAFVAKFGGEKVDESPKARRVAGMLGMPLDELEIGAVTQADLESLVAHLDEPFADGALVPLTKIAEAAARRGCRVVLTGDGGDEQQGGYFKAPVREGGWVQGIPLARRYPVVDALFRLRVPLRYRLRRGLAPELATLLPRHTWHPSDFAVRREREVCRDFLLDQDRDLRRRTDSQYDYLSAWFFFYLTSCYTQKTDIATMRYSLESRAPLMDHRLFELTAQLDPARSFREGRGKYWIRQLLAARFDAAFLDAPKQGFSVPFKSWAKTRLPALEATRKRIRVPHFHYKMAWTRWVLDRFLEQA